MIITLQQLEEDYMLCHCENQQGFAVDILNLGGIVQNITLPNGKEMVLGYDTPQEYLNHCYYFGATIGPFANRISNANYSLHGVNYPLEKNQGEHCLHSGSTGLHQKIFDVKIEGDCLLLHTTLPHLEGGFSGNRNIELRYHVDEENLFTIEYRGSSDKDTIFNLTNHSYFHLGGGYGDCLSHTMEIASQQFTLNNGESVPTGEILPVENTPLDFRVAKEIGADISSPLEIMTQCGGYDHNFILDNQQEFQKVAIATCGDVSMTLFSDCPCMQFYTGNFIDTHIGKKRSVYHKRSGFCLETGDFPNGINTPTFPSNITKAGDIWQYKTGFQFSWKDE